MEIKATLYPRIAPGGSVSNSMVVSQEALLSATGKLTASTEADGVKWEILDTQGIGIDFYTKINMPGAREMLNLAYLDYFNNYLTVETYADHHGLSTEHARAFLELAKLVLETPHPES